MLTLTKISETDATLVLGWTPPAGVGGYVFYANAQPVSTGSPNFQSGAPRNTVKFSKTNPGPPFHVVAACLSSQGSFSLESGMYPVSPFLTVYPGMDVFPSEVSP